MDHLILVFIGFIIGILTGGLIAENAFRKK